MTFERGEGAWLWDTTGRRYLDALSGVAVCGLGHAHPAVQEALCAQAGRLVHTSNIYGIALQEQLGEQLARLSGMERAFFCNSGAEANEGAFKFARRATGRTEIVAFSGGFHGRLFASLAATDRPDYRRPFEPLLAGVHIVAAEDRRAAERAIDAPRTAAVIVEPVQGEGGVRPASAEWLGDLRTLCDERGAALVFDEVQCGLGRTGTLFAYEATGVVPDLLTLAKPLAGGFPMGAVLLNERIAAAARPGDHATTFGGGPLVASVALAVLQAIADPAFLADVREKSGWLASRLQRLGAQRARVREVRGRGLMWGIELVEPAAARWAAMAVLSKRQT